MPTLFRSLRSDENGGILVEVTVMLTILMLLVLGSVDFLMAMYQWNAAAKAVQIGARIAAVSSPVSSDLSTITTTVLSSTVHPGDQMPYFVRVCSGGSCTNGGTFSFAALATIVYGRNGNTSCQPVSSVYAVGMCHVFSRVTPANVVISYEQTGLGYAGRPGGPVPTITVSLNLSFQFFFVGFLPGFGNIQIPAMATITAEDLSSSAPTT